MRITKAMIEQRMKFIEARYRDVVGVEIDPDNGYAQCSKFSTTRSVAWSCSPAENAHRLYGEWSSLRDLLDGNR